MRKILFSVLILAVLILALPYGMGYMVENKINKIEAKLKSGELGGGGYAKSFNITNYQRGWFSSNLDLSGTATLGSQSIDMTAHTILHHGPILKTPQGIMLGQAYAEIVSQSKQSDSANNLTVTYTIYFDLLGNIHLKATMPETPVFKADANQIKLGEAKGESVVSSDLNKVSSQGQLKDVVISAGPYEFKGTGFNGSIQMSQDPLGVWVGKGAFSIDDINGNNASQPMLQLSGFNLNYDTNITSGLYNITFVGKFNKLMIENYHFGPFEKVSRLLNLDAKTIVDMNNQVKKVAKNPNMTQQEMQMVSFSLIPKIPDLINQGAEYDLDKFELGVEDQGKIVANGYVKLAKPTENASLLNLDAFKKRLNVNFHVEMPQVVLQNLLTISMKQKMKNEAANNPNWLQENAPNAANLDQALPQKSKEMAAKQIQMWVQNHLLVQDKDQYKFDLSYQDGKLKINNQDNVAIPLQF